MLRAADGYYEEVPFEARKRGPRLRHERSHTSLVTGARSMSSGSPRSRFSTASRRDIGKNGGGNGTGPVNTVAKLWGVNRPGDGRIQVGGHAYAGTRGIKTVEVSTDGGDNWTEAALSPQPLRCGRLAAMEI